MNNQKVQEITNRLRSCRLLIVDLDGTLVDTEPYHLRSYELILSTFIGEDIELQYSDIVGKRGVAIWQELVARYSLSLNLERLNHLRKVVLAGLLGSVSLEANPAVMAIVNEFSGSSIILTVQELRSAKQLLDRTGVSGAFKDIISLQQPGVPKTKLQVIQAIANEKGLRLDEIAWIEDAAPDISAGKEAGIVTLIVPREYNRANIAAANYLLLLPQG